MEKWIGHLLDEVYRLKTVIYGTNNSAKVSSMQRNLKGLEIEVVDLSSFGQLDSAEETGNDPLENAIIKAKGYYAQVKRPVFSCDTGLYIEKIDEKHQPGVRARRVGGGYMNDDEMRAFYSDLAKRYGGKLVAFYKNAICLVVSEDEIYTYDGDELNSERFYIVETAHVNRREGFPLDSLSVDIASGKYYEDLENIEKNLAVNEGFRQFFIRTLLEE